MFHQKVTKFISEYDLLKKGSTVVVGVSGGPDSLALLHFLYTQRQAWKLRLVVAHVDHMFRGKESEQEMYFVEEICNRYRIPFEGKRIDVSAYQVEVGVGGQVAARECRYAFFHEVMHKHNADFLALGHHGDDQIETILMRLVRGSTLEGISGMKKKRPFETGYLIRPFLSVTKAEIYAYCEMNNVIHCEDPSNKKEVYTRNRFRKWILPHLQEENPAVHERFMQFSQSLAEDDEYLRMLTVEKMSEVIIRHERDEIAITILPFESLSMPLQRRGIQLILNYLYGNKLTDVSSIHINQILALLRSSNPSGKLNLPNGLTVQRSYSTCIFTFRQKKGKEYQEILSLEGIIHIGNDSTILSSLHTIIPSITNHQYSFLCDLKDISLPLMVRSRKNGDKMTLKGMKGSKKIKDIFIDCKIPKEARDTWPVVVDAKGTIIWLPGVKKSSFEAKEQEVESYLLLQYFSNDTSRRTNDEARY
ncbi:tRNA lysidine(34) synthetase TilS [Priestia taiwanensis]